jgi:glutaminyl-peptide cyclotransferase
VTAAPRALAALAVLALAACADTSGRPLDVRKVARPETSADRAWSYLTEQMAHGPRYSGVGGHRRQLVWMKDFLGFRADTVIEQVFTHRTADGKDTRFVNVLARFNPAATERVLLVAHWDTRPDADRALDPADRKRPVPGANDGASGTAVLFELAEQFRQQRPTIGVDLLFTDGEDFGPGAEDMFLGSRHFARNLPPGPKPRWALVVDMVGDRDLRIPVEPHSQRSAPALVDRVWTAAAALGHEAHFPRTAGPAITDDHLPLAEAGIPAAVLIDFEYGPGNAFWHSPEDLIAQVDAASLGVVADVLAAVVYAER